MTLIRLIQALHRLLWQEICASGYPGGSSSVRDCLARFRGDAVMTAPVPEPPKLRAVVAWIMTTPGDLDPPTRPAARCIRGQPVVAAENPRAGSPGSGREPPYLKEPGLDGKRLSIPAPIRSIDLALVFGVGYVRSPVRSPLGDGQVCHEVVGTGAVPVFFSVGREDHVAGIELDHLLAADLDPAVAFGDVQSLSAVVGMPGAARSRREADCGDI